MNNRQIQRERDKKILVFLKKFKVATTDTIAELFFPSLRMAQRRLTKLVDYGALNRTRDHFTFQYMYYIEKPRQMHHRLILTDFYREVTRLGVKIVKFDNEFTFFDGIRPDGFIAYRYEGKNYMAFVETELSNRPNTKKYEELYDSEIWKGIFPIFPTVIWVTDQCVPKTKLDIIQIKTDLFDIKNIVH